MTLTSPENMMKVRAVSPLELSQALDAWGAAMDTLKSDTPHPLLKVTGPLGPTPEELAENNHSGYSKRTCAGLFEWLKEV